MPPELHLSIPSRRSACRVVLCAVAVQTQLVEQLEQTPSNASKLHTCTPAVCLQSSSRKLPNFIPRCLYVCTPAARFESSRAPFLHTYTLAACLPSSRARYLYASMSALPQRVSRAPELHTPLAPRPRPRPHTFITPPELQFLHAYTPAARFLSSRAPELHSSTPTRPQRAFLAPQLHTSFEAAPAAHPQSSGAP